MILINHVVAIKFCILLTFSVLFSATVIVAFDKIVAILLQPAHFWFIVTTHHRQIFCHSLHPISTATTVKNPFRTRAIFAVPITKG